MKLVSLTAQNHRKGETVKAEFSDGSSFFLSTDYLKGIMDFCQWEDGRELSSREEDALLFAGACFKAEKIALRLIARAEQSSLALTAKLEKRGIEAAAVKAVISLLVERELLNDTRYAELWIRSRLGSKSKALSPLRLLVSLGKRGIDRGSSLDAIRKVLDEETEYALLLKYLEETDVLDDKGGRFLKTRLKHEGFSFQTIEKFFETI